MASRQALIKSELLLVQHRLGKRGALEQLVALWERPLYYFVRRLVGTEEEAKDLAQDIWIAVVRKIGALRDPAAFPAWLFKVARTHALNHFRKARPLDPLDEESAAECAATHPNHLALTLNAEELHWALGQLRPAHSECLILHFLEGFSVEEVADITGVAPGTVKSRIHYAKKAIREILDEEAKCDEQ